MGLAFRPDGSTAQLESVNSASIQDASILAIDIADLQIVTNKLADLAVTAAKIAGDTIGAAQIAADAVGSSELANNAVDTNALQALAVTAAKVANDSLTASQLATDAVGAAEIAAGAVGTSEIADGTVASGDLATGAAAGNLGTGGVTSALILDNAVTSTDIADGTITGADVQDGSITSADIAAGATFVKPVELRIAQGMGANLVAMSLDPALASQAKNVPSSYDLISVLVPEATTITGVRLPVSTAGVYTNTLTTIGLYSIDPATGTITRVAITPDDATLLKTAGTVSKAFTAPYAAAAGVYYVAVGYSATGVTTTPQIAASGAMAQQASGFAAPNNLGRSRSVPSGALAASYLSGSISNQGTGMMLVGLY